MDAEQALELYGTGQPRPTSLELHAGDLSCQVVGGALRRISWRGVEVVRAVSYLLRDADWGTVPAEVVDPILQQTEQRFELRFTLRMRAPQATLMAQAQVLGEASGRLEFSVSAQPDAPLPTNRCGFVVLHPAACAGRELAIEHTGGGVECGRFPDTISPGQPAFDIRALRHEMDGGVRVDLRLQAELPGDPAGKFEMEDQRNWSDASYKTYVASLLDPWPYTLPADRALSQRVTLVVSGGAAAQAEGAGRDAAARLTLGPAGPVRLPAFAVGVPPGLHRASAAEQTALLQSATPWWVMEAELGEPGSELDLAAAARLQDRNPAKLQLDLVLPDRLLPREAADAAAAAVAAAGLKVHALRLLPRAYLKSYQPSDRWPELPPLQDYAQAARALFPGALIGGGMFTGFTELNRLRPSGAGLDFIGHLTWPIVHDADDGAVMQTLEALPHIGRSVQALWPGLAYRLGPSTLAMRRNPYGVNPAPNPNGIRLPLASSDPRQRGRFGAAWTLGYAARVVPLGLDLLALHESHGASGPTAGQGTTLVPAWGVLQQLARASQAAWLPCGGQPEALAALFWQHPGQAVEGLLGNLGETPLSVRLPEGLGAATVGLRPYEVLAIA